MAGIEENVFFGNKIVPFNEASLSIASSAVLYGLSVYTVFQITPDNKGKLVAFRLEDHFKRLVNSARIIGIDNYDWDYKQFKTAVKQLAASNKVKKSVFARATLHVDQLVPGTKSRGLSTALSIFLYNAESILPLEGARLKTSVWRRIPDYSIPSRAKVNGAYINSVLAKQDALDSGYDDCIFLDSHGHVCELSAANIFMVRDNKLVTPDATHDLLEGINRMTVIELAKNMGIEVVERPIDLTELYIADEVFACGTSAYLTPIIEIDARQIGSNGRPITDKLQEAHQKVLIGGDARYKNWLSKI